MKHIYIVWLLLCGIGTSYAQTITITDQQTNTPIEGALLMSESPQATAVTNTLGQTDVTAFADAKSILIRSLGHKPIVLSYKQIEMADFTIELEQSSLSLDQVVISATRWHQSSRNVPSKVISISTKDVSLLNPQTAADLLGISGKVFIQKSQQGGGSPMIRGFATNRLVYTVDGVRMNTAIFRGGNLQNVISLDPFATENTEVMFGPGSVIYGSDAIGGVMSFQTLTPQLSLTKSPFVTGKAVARYASANQEKTGHFHVNVGWEKWALVSSFSSWDFDHLRQGSHGPEEYIKSVYPQRQDTLDVVVVQDDPLLQIPSAYSQINMMQKIRFKPNENWDLQYGFHYSETSSYGRYDRHNRYRNGTLRYAEWNYGAQLWMMNNLNISHNGNNKVYDLLSVRLAQQSFEESRIDRSFNRDERTTNTENVEAFSLNLDLTKSVGAKNTLFYGAEYIFNDVTSDGKLTDITDGTEQQGPSRYPQATWSSVAAYINDEFRVSEKLILQGGVRYNQFVIEADFSNNSGFYPFPFTTATVNNGALTGSIGAVVRPNDGWVVKVNMSTAFRSPNVDDIGKVFDSEPGAVIVPNPDLKAEYAYNADLGAGHVFGEVLKVDVTGYYTLLKNALVRRNFQLNGADSIVYDGQMSQVQAMQNAAEAHVYGVQAGVEIKLPAGFTVLSDLNYQHGKEEMSDGTTSASRHAAPLFGVSRLRYVYKGLSLEFNATYQGERSFKDLAVEEQGKDEIYAKDNNGNNYAPSWYTLNFKAMCQLGKNIGLSCGVENITDQRYRPYSSGISAAGRNVMLSVNVKF